MVWQYLAVSCRKFQGISILWQLGADSMGIHILSAYFGSFVIQSVAWNSSRLIYEMYLRLLWYCQCLEWVR